VLGRTHLAAIGALVLTLVAGIAVLAFIVLSQGAEPPQTADASRGTGVEAAPPAAPHAASVAPAAGGSSTPAPPTEPGSSQKAADTSGAGREVATAGSVPVVPRAATKPPAAGRATSSAAAPPAGVRTARAETAAATKEADTRPPVSALPSVTFENVRILLVETGGRGREREGRLELTGDQLIVLNREDRSPLTAVPYSAVVSAHYSRSRQPRWRDADGREVESKVDLGRLGFLRSDRNWLILITRGDPVVLRFEDAGLNTALGAVEERLGMRINR
jgi:hypothetical protein